MPRILRSALLAILVGAAFPPAATADVPAAPARYRIERTPAWVAKIPAPTAERASAGATVRLLDDVQLDFTGPAPVAYYRLRSVARERAGLERVGSLRIPFNPSFQALSLHELAVFRDGRRIDRLKSARIDFAQRERFLEEGIYDGNVEAILALPDVRVGDAVEIAFSITGDNPIFGGMLSSSAGLDGDQPIERLALRIRHPAARPLQHRLHRSDLQVAESTANGVRTLRIDAEGLAPVRDEVSTPGWFFAYPELQLSEYASWEDVRAWARKLYAVPQDLGPEIEAVVERIRRETPEPQDRAVRALRWVQDEIRYYSVAVGTSSHRPNHPNQTVRQRFGDCKDKSVLLAAMLRRLGLDAEPALVSTWKRHGIAEMLPTPKVFDHVVVRLRLGGETHWLDATRSYQGDRLETLGAVDFGKALPISDDAPGLEDVRPAAGGKPGMTVAETFRIGKFGAPVELVTRVTHRGSVAEHFRRERSGNGAQRTVEQLQADYGSDFPGLTPVGEPRLDDDPAANTVTLTQAFSVPHLFEYENGRVTARGLYARFAVPLLKMPATPERKFPFALPYPARFEHDITLELPLEPPGQVPAPTQWRDRHLAVASRIGLPGRRSVAFHYEAEVLGNHVPARDFAAFTEAVHKKALPLMFSSLSMPVADAARLRARLVRASAWPPLRLRPADDADDLREVTTVKRAIAHDVVENGLLDGPLLAKALRDRATASSLLGNRAEALEDAARAIALDPDDAGHELKAEIEMYDGRHEDALATLARIRAGERTSVRMNAGLAKFHLGDFREARREFERAADAAGGNELTQALLWLTVAAGRDGDAPPEAVARHRGRLGTDWPAQALPFLLGESGEDEFVAAARSGGRASRMQLCEAYFFAGQKALADGRSADARRWFAKAVDTDVTMYREHAFAQQALARLGPR